MKTELTVNQRINFKSHFPQGNFLRIKRVEHYAHHAENGNYKSFDVPFWQELQKFKEGKFITFLNKF